MGGYGMNFDMGEGTSMGSRVRIWSYSCLNWANRSKWDYSPRESSIVSLVICMAFYAATWAWS